METKLSYEQLLAENIELREQVKNLQDRLYQYEPHALHPIEPEPLIPESAVIVQNATVICLSSTDDKVDLFMSLFRGRDDIYAKHWYSIKTEKSGYQPVCLNEREHGLCDKKKYKCNNCPNRKLAALNNNTIFTHLSGKNQTGTDIVGLYPMTTDECCYFLAIDSDDDEWQRDVAAFRNTCAELGITAYAERSRSGNGGHIWFFFEDKIPAPAARKFGSALLTEAMSRNHEIKFRSYDRLFPNQDTMPNGGFGNLIALPLQGLARKSGNSLFIDENFNPYHDQWAFLSCVQKLSFDTVESYIRRLCGKTELGILSSTGIDDENEVKPWEKVKPQVELTSLDFGSTVMITKSNMLHISKTGISQKALNRIKRLGAFKNPDFYKSQAMRLPTYNKPRIIDTTEETPQYLSIPRGYEYELMQMLDSVNARYTVEDKRNSDVSIDIEFNGTLRPEQELAASSLLNHEMGILSATTAFGKTVVGSYLISQRKVNTLVLVHTSALLDQWKTSLSQFLIINEKLPEEPKNADAQKSYPLSGSLVA